MLFSILFVGEQVRSSAILVPLPLDARGASESISMERYRKALEGVYDKYNASDLVGTAYTCLR